MHLIELTNFKKTRINGKLVGLILSHVDDFTIAGTQEFVQQILAGIEEKFTVSKVEEDNFRFTGLDVKTKNGKLKFQWKIMLNQFKTLRK